MFVNFFINDVLNVKSDYEVIGQIYECEGEHMGAPCGSLADNAVCTGDYFDNTCIAECDLYHAKIVVLRDHGLPASFSMSCEVLAAGIPPTDHVTGLCPGAADNICFMRKDGELFDYGQAELVNINTLFEEHVLNEM